MAIVTSVLTGGVNNHETTSEEANAYATDFVSEGIVGTIGNTSGVAPATGGFAVNAQGTPDNTVAISSGVAYVTATPTSQNSQALRIKNSASTNLTISANSSGSTKYDWIYINISATNAANPNIAGDDVATITVSRSSSPSTDDGTPPTYGFPIAVITVANGFSTITNANIRDVRTRTTLNTGTNNAVDGWTALSTALTISTGYNKGNKEYDITSATDLTAVLSPGMRLKVTRATTPPTQCTDLEASSSQYASRASGSLTGITFTDDFTVEAWVKLESYHAASMSIASRYNGTSGWSLRIGALGNNDGRIQLLGTNGGGGNFSATVSYQSIPLGRWVHIAACLDMSAFTTTASPIYIDGVSVPVAVSRGGTNPTALVQAGDLQVGSENGSAGIVDAKIADVRVWNAVRTATQVRDNMNQQLVGNETNLVAYFKLNGDFNDSTSNANNLTAQGGAAATNSDNPMNSTEYAIVTKVTASTITVFTGTDYNIPNMTLSTPYYSTQKVPFGFPAEKAKWRVRSLHRTTDSTTSNSSYGAYVSGGWALLVPVGAWRIGWQADLYNVTTTVMYFALSPTALTGLTTSQAANVTNLIARITSPSAAVMTIKALVEDFITASAAQTYVMYTLGTTTSAGIDGTVIPSEIFAECAYI